MRMNITGELRSRLVRGAGLVDSIGALANALDASTRGVDTDAIDREVQDNIRELLAGFSILRGSSPTWSLGGIELPAPDDEAAIISSTSAALRYAALVRAGEAPRIVGTTGTHRMLTLSLQATAMGWEKMSVCVLASSAAIDSRETHVVEHEVSPGWRVFIETPKLGGALIWDSPRTAIPCVAVRRAMYNGIASSTSTKPNGELFRRQLHTLANERGEWLKNNQAIFDHAYFNETGLFLHPYCSRCGVPLIACVATCERLGEDGKPAWGLRGDTIDGTLGLTRRPAPSLSDRELTSALGTYRPHNIMGKIMANPRSELHADDRHRLNRVRCEMCSRVGGESWHVVTDIYNERAQLPAPIYVRPEALNARQAAMFMRFEQGLQGHTLIVG